MQGWGSNLKVWTSSSRRSTQPRVAVWGWGSRSAAPLSKIIMAGYGQHRMMAREPRFRFPFPANPSASWGPTVLTPFGCLRWRLRRTYEESVKVMQSFVSVVDDDESVRESLPDLLRE